MLALGAFAAIVGFLLILFLFGIRAELSWLKVDWQNRPPAWLAWPIAVGLFAIGVLIVFAAERAAPKADPSVNAATPANPAEAGTRTPASNTTAAAPVSAGDEPEPMARENLLSRRTPPASSTPPRQPPAGRTAIADNGSVAVAGDISGGSTVIANGDDNRSDRQP